MGNATSGGDMDEEQVADCVKELEALQGTEAEENKTKNGTQAYNHLAKFTLDCTLQEFLLLFWEDEEQHVRFLEEKIFENNIHITPWLPLEAAVPDTASKEAKTEAEGDSPPTTNPDPAAPACLQRTVSVCHPLPIQLPWLPLVVQNACRQRISYGKANPREIRIFERSKVSAIPFCEPIVTASWVVTEEDECVVCEVTLSWECEGSHKLNPDPNLGPSHSSLPPPTRILIYFPPPPPPPPHTWRAVFWALQGQIEYYSRLAMGHFYEQWTPHAAAIIERRRRIGSIGSIGVGLQEGEWGGALVSQFWRQEGQGPPVAMV